MSAGEVLKRKKPRTRSVERCLDDEQVELRNELIEEISRMKRLESWADSGDMASPLPALQDELRGVLKSIDEATVEFNFRAISRNDWNAAVEKYTDDDGTLTEPFEVFIVANSSYGSNKMTMKQSQETKIVTTDDILKVLTIADEAVCGATWCKGADQRTLNYAAGKIRELMKKLKE